MMMARTAVSVQVTVSVTVPVTMAVVRVYVAFGDGGTRQRRSQPLVDFAQDFVGVGFVFVVDRRRFIQFVARHVISK